jgi:ubiquinone/menaquinone biosynthesis C-methylase UbiE
LDKPINEGELMLEPGSHVGGSQSEIYEQYTVNGITRPWAKHLLGRASLAAGMSVLDVACGTGVVARLAKLEVGSTGHVVGLDIDKERLALAHASDPTVEWRAGSAVAMPFPDGSFDAAFLLHGLQFFGPDRSAALSETRRVLKPDGKLLVAAWGPVKESPLFDAFFKHLGHGLNRQLQPPAFSLHDPNELYGLLAQAGFQSITIEPATLDSHFPSVKDFVEYRLALLGRMRRGATITEQLGPDGLSALVAGVTGDVQQYIKEQEVVAPMRANVAIASPLAAA